MTLLLLLVLLAAPDSIEVTWRPAWAPHADSVRVLIEPDWRAPFDTTVAILPARLAWALHGQPGEKQGWVTVTLGYRVRGQWINPLTAAPFYEETLELDVRHPATGIRLTLIRGAP